MLTRLVKCLLHSAPLFLLTTALIQPVSAFGEEQLEFFRTPDNLPAPPDLMFRSPRLNATVSLNQNGDLLIQYGRTSFVLAYSPPVDRFKPSEQPAGIQREQQANAINGISLTASLTF